MKRIRILILLVPLLIMAWSRSTAQNIFIHSDTSWLTDLGTDTIDWTTNPYDDASWGNSVIAIDTGCHYPLLAVDTLGALMWSGPAPRTDTMNFFRKHFTIPCLNTITDATISFTADDSAQLFLNGNAIGGVVESVSDGIVTYSYADIEPYLVCGDNVIAVRAEDGYAICWWAYFNMNITLQPLTISTDTTVSACDSVYIGDVNAPVGPGYIYQWVSVTSGTPDPSPNNVPYVQVNPQISSVYMFIVETPCCIDTLYDTVNVTPCCTSPVAQLSINGSISNNDTICSGSDITLTANGGIWGEYYMDDPSAVTSLMPVPVGGRADIVSTSGTTLGAHTLCFIAFTDNPDSTNHWCSDTTCLTFILQSCCTKPTAQLRIDSPSSGNDTICSGSSIIVTANGGIWGEYYIDNNMVSNGAISISAGGRIDTLPTLGDSIGTHTLCFVAYSSDPDSTAGWCADTACITFVVQTCPCTVHATLAVSADTFCIGQPVALYSTGGAYGQYFIDNGADASGINPEPIGGSHDTVPALDATPGVHTICYVAFSSDPDSTSGWCSDTACFTFVVQNCPCTVHASLTVSGDTFCAGQTIAIYSTGGANGQYIIDNGVNVSSIKPEPVGGRYDTVPSGYFLPGVHTICYVAFSSDPDSTTGWCSDTACVTIVVQSCPCTVHANITLDGDTFCVGQVVYAHTTNLGYYAELLIDGQNKSNGVGFIGSSDIGPIAPDPTSIGTHVLCLIVYSAYPDSTNDWCADTACITVVVRSCGCDTLIGKAQIAETHNNLSYDFYNAGAVNASFIDWIVDGNQEAQTPYGGHFSWDFMPGFHDICMRAAYILPGPDGTNICCYVEDCDTITVDTCAYWKATDSITYLVDSSDYHNVIFTYHGNTQPVPTVIWNFGDGTTAVNDGSQPTSHTYATTGNVNLCVNVIWSLDSIYSLDSLQVCCCVDTVCFSVNVNPCNDRRFTVSVVEDLGTFVSFQVTPSAAINVISVLWSVDQVPVVSGISPYFGYYPTSGDHSICANVTYDVVYPGDSIPTQCTGESCIQFNSQSRDAERLMRYYPNPTNNIMTVEVEAISNDKASIQVMDYMGRTIATHQYENLTQGVNSLYLNLNDLIIGVYAMKVTIGGTSTVVKVVKE